MASRAAHCASKRSSSWELLAVGAVSWLPSGGQVLLPAPFPPLLEVPFCWSIRMLLWGGRPLIAVDSGGVEENGGVENPPAFPTPLDAPG